MITDLCEGSESKKITIRVMIIFANMREKQRVVSYFPKMEPNRKGGIK